MVLAMTAEVETPVFIDLKDAISSNRPTILTGKPRGLAARTSLDVDRIYAEHPYVVIRVPKNIVGITSSFTNGLLGGAVEKSGGLEAFLERLVVYADPQIVASMVRDLRKGNLPPLQIPS